MNPTEELCAKLDEHVPRPANPSNTCVVLQGEKPPEEVLFVRKDGVTHYLPEGAGTLTAEQVRECVKEVYFEGYSDGATHRVNGIEETDWQTIADKLNATMSMEQAADTILELRDDLQRANNAVQDAEHDESMAWDRVRKAEAENAKLVDVLHEVEAEAVHAYRCLQQDCVTTANSSQHFFDKWWHAECELDRLKAENTDLWELASLLLYGMHHDAPPHEELLWSQKVNLLMNVLGIKVGE